MEKITILITDDHTMLRETWGFLLNKDPRFNVAALTGTGEEAIEMVMQVHPDIVLMDIGLPGINGIEATQTIRKISPATKVLGVSMHTQSSYVCKMIQGGASGYVTKNSSIEEMCRAIIAVHNNQTYICEAVKNTIVNLSINSHQQEKTLSSVSKKEMQVIEFVRKGYSSREIANFLKVSVKTIDAHRYNVLKKLKLKNVAALVNYFNNN